MDKTSEVQPIPVPVTHLWDCVKEALAENGNPSPRRIDRMAAAAGLELAANTISGWFKTWSVVPTWERFDVLIKALGAERDRDWRSLHGAALTADRLRKRKEREQTELNRSTALSAPPSATSTDGQQSSLESSSAESTSAVLLPTRPLEIHDPDDTKFVTILTKVKMWKTSRALWVIVGIIVSFSAFAIYAYWLVDGNTRTSQPPSRRMVQNCAYVIREPAAVYPIPNPAALPIKFKYLGDRVGVSDHLPHPVDWIVVRTPQDGPGLNWMQAAVLGDLVAC